MFWEVRLCPNSLPGGAAEGTAKGSGLEKATLPGGRLHDTERGSFGRGGGGGGGGAQDRETCQLHDRGGEASRVFLVLVNQVQGVLSPRLSGAPAWASSLAQGLWWQNSRCLTALSLETKLKIRVACHSG